MTPSTRRRRVGAAAGALALTLVLDLAASIAPAAADPLGDARAQAAALTAQVDRLQTQAEVATEHYDALETALGTAVVRQSLAERAAEADQATAQAAAAQVQDRVRALYESGGRMTLLVTVLDGSDPQDAVSRLHTVSSLLSYDAAGAAADLTTSTAATQRAARLATAASHVTRLQHAAAEAAGKVQTLLQAQRAALSTATGEVRTLVTQRQAALAAASAQAFRNALAAAGGVLPTNTAPPNATAGGAISAAETRLGDSYVWGATGPDTFDCSGLTQWSYAQVGIALPRVAADQWNAGPHVALDALQPGDLLFWATDLSNAATIHHVAIYLGAGQMLAAPHTGDVVQIQPVYLDGYFGATRPYGTSA